MPDNLPTEHSGKLDPIRGPISGSKPQLPNHELLRCIGSGAFGEVWLARNIMGTYRAAKVIYLRNFSDKRPYDREFHGLQRFEPISRSHDGFVDILDTGQEADEGYFYYVMEVADDVVSGNKIEPESYKPKTLDNEAAKSGCIPVQTCVSLGVSLSAALAHLHEHGLLHRDIKPSNIIFVNGIPKIADIGLVAKVEGTQTSPGFTTGYFSPRDGPGTVQADIYALGKVLYEISTGQDRCDFPVLPADLDSKQDPDQFRELNQVILKACEDDPHKRYRKAEDMHADLVLLLAGKSVRRIRVLEKRLKQLLQVGMAAALVLAIGGGGLFARNQHLKRLAAEQKRQQAHRDIEYGINLENQGDFFGAFPLFSEALKLDRDDPFAETNNRLRIGSLLQQCPRITQLRILKDQQLMAADLSQDGQYVLTAAMDGTTTLFDVNTGVASNPWPKESKWLEAVSFSPDGKYAATAGEGFVKVWDMETHALVSRAAPPATVYNVKFISHGSRFVTACGNGTQGFVYIYDTKAPGKGTEFTSSTAAYRCIAFNSTETRLAAACENGLVQVWDFTTKQKIGAPISHVQGPVPPWVYCVAFSPDDLKVLSVAEHGTIKMSDAETGQGLFLLRYPPGVKSGAFSPDGRYFVTACWDYAARISDASTGDLIHPTLKINGKYLIYASFSADGHRILTVSANGVICVWDLATPIISSPGEGDIFASQDGHRLCSIQDTNINVFDAGNHAHPTNIVANAVRAVLLNKDGTRLITLSETLQSTNSTTVAQLWNSQTAQPLSPRFAIDGSPTQAFLSDDGKHLVAWKGMQATVWDTQRASRLYSLNHTNNVSEKGGCFSPKGAWLATISESHVSLWNALDGSRLWIQPHVDSVEHVAFSPDSRFMVTCDGSPNDFSARSAQLWEVKSGRQVWLPLQHEDGVKYAEFSPDGSLLVTAGEDGAARIWSVLSGALLSVLQTQSTVTEARFTADGRWIVTASQMEGAARVWDARTGEALTPPLKHPWHFTQAQFIDGNHKILTRPQRGQAGKPMVWDLPIETRIQEESAPLENLLSGKDSTKSDVNANEISWNLREAEDCETAGQWRAAAFHWEHLVRAKPDNQTYQNRLKRAQDFLNTTNAARGQ